MTCFRSTSLIAALCVMQIAAGTSLARAQDANAPTRDSQADSLTYKQLAQKGAQAFADKDYATAADAFQRAYDLNPVANLLYNIGRALEMQGRFKEANAAYTRFVVQPNVELKARQDALQRIETLQKVIAIQAAGGDIDTEAVEKEQGEHQLVSMEELKAETAKFKEEFSKPSAETSGLSEEQPKDDEFVQSDALDDQIPGEASDTASSPDYTLVYVFGAASLAAFAGTASFGFLSSERLDDAGRAKTLSERREALEAARLHAWAADGLALTGVALAGVGVYFWLTAGDDSPQAQATSRPSQSEASPVSITPLVSHDRAGVTFTMGF